MKINEDGLYSAFCCSSLEYCTKQPLQCIIFDPLYKSFDNEEGEHRACIFTKASGVAIKEREGKKTSAGRNMIAISHCPFCGSPIKFE